jgi:hypothetical protein
VTLLARRSREVYRVYGELEYLSGAADADCPAPAVPDAPRRRGGSAAAVTALLVVGGTSVTLLATRGSGASGAKPAPDARPSGSPVAAAHTASLSASRARQVVRTRPRPIRRIAGIDSAHQRRSAVGGLPRKRHAAVLVSAATVRRIAYARGAVAVAVAAPRQASNPGEGQSPSRRQEFGFER